MAIQFPCLQTDISEWFHSPNHDFCQGFDQEAENLVDTLKQFLLTPRHERYNVPMIKMIFGDRLAFCSAEEENNVIEHQPTENKWLHNNCTKSNNIKPSQEDDNNIMSPVLNNNVLPNSHWLLKTEETGEEQEPTEAKGDDEKPERVGHNGNSNFFSPLYGYFHLVGLHLHLPSDLQNHGELQDLHRRVPRLPVSTRHRHVVGDKWQSQDHWWSGGLAHHWLRVL